MPQFGSPDTQRRKAWLTQVINDATQATQSVHQIADGPLMHARHTRELIVDRLSTGHGQGRGQGAKGCPGIAQKQAGLLHWRQPGAPLYLQLPGPGFFVYGFFIPGFFIPGFPSGFQRLG